MPIYMSSGPAGEPISRTEAKMHMRVDAAAEDDLTDAIITAAREWVETLTRRQLVTATRVMLRDNLPSRIVLPRPPLQSISSVTYVDAAGDTQTASSALYEALIRREPGEMILGYGDSWPTTRGHTNDVTITWKCGYSSIFTAATNDTLTVSGRTLVDDDVVRVWASGGNLPTGLSANTDYYIISADADAGTCELSPTSGGDAVDVTAVGSGTHYMGDMPGPIRAAIRLMIAHLFENREAVITGTMAKEAPLAVMRLLWPYRLFTEDE